MNQVPLILASGSPRRKFLLKQIGLDFQVIPSDIYEDFSLRLPSKDLAEHFAQLKAHSVANQFPDRLVIGADTTGPVARVVSLAGIDNEFAPVMLYNLD